MYTFRINLYDIQPINKDDRIKFQFIKQINEKIKTSKTT